VQAPIVTTDPPGVPDSLRRRMLAAITTGNVLNSFGFRVWQALFNNFAVLHFAATAGQIGVAQSVREIPGLLGAGIGFMALALAEMRIAAISLVVMGVGIIMTGASDGYSALLLSTLVMSSGFHAFVSSSWAAALHLSGKDQAPRTLGRLNSVCSAGAVAAAAAVFLALDAAGFRAIFAATGAVVAAGGLALLPFSLQPPRVRPGARPTPLRREYSIYYALEFLMGSRRHIFSTFAIYLLVREYAAAAQTIALLLALNNVVGAFLFRYFGTIIARFGERRVLAVTLGLLVVVFLGYAFVPLLSVLYVLFFLDQILLGFSVATQSYFRKIALHPDEITPNICLGQTINHVAAVIIPVVGGLVWEAIGSRHTFLAGALIVVASLFVVRLMPGRRNQGNSTLPLDVGSD
jgi:predicted MFS family arabinose efflux permease